MAVDTDLHGQSLVEALDDSDRVAAGKPDQAKAKNIRWDKFKELIINAVSAAIEIPWFKNQEAEQTAGIIAPEATSRGLPYTADSGFLYGVESDNLEDGDTIWVLLEKAGQQIRHNSGDVTGTQIAFFLQVKGDYVASAENETFEFRLWTRKTDGVRRWIEQGNNSITGGGSPSSYTALKSQMPAKEVDSTTVITGFADGSLVGADVKGDKTSLTVSLNNNTITFSGTGAVTGVVLASGEVYEYVSGTDFLKSTENDSAKVANIVNGGNETTNDNGEFKLHSNGAVTTDTGIVLPNYNDKTIQITV